MRLAILILAASPALAETDPAIGRLNHAGYRERIHCTVSLIGPAEALTAKHCVEDLPVDALHVLLGYDRGSFAEHLRVMEVQASAEHDVARLCLDATSEATPFALSDVNVGSVTPTGYPRSQAHLQRSHDCIMLPKPPIHIWMSCPLEPGMSGAPILSNGRVAGVVSSTTDEVSFAVRLDALPPGGCEAP